MTKIQSKTNRVSANPVKLIAALGNPGKEYEKTYHNVGWLFVNFLKDKLGVSGEKIGTSYKYYTTKSDRPIILAEPRDLFMNDSGRYIASIIKHLNLKPDEFMLVHDDSDIPLGEYKLTSGSGSAGHKGIKSVIDALGAKDFLRLRIGIRHGEGQAGEFVLSTIKRREEEILQNTFEKILTAIGLSG